MQQILYFFRFWEVLSSLSESLTIMTKKKNWKESTFAWIVKHLLFAVAFAVIAIGILLLSLRRYTEHGVEIIVPDITGLYIEEAKITLEAEGLHLEVIDSTYSNKAPLGTIVEQTPTATSKVKNGRTIYAIQNARLRRPVILPEMRDISLRQAEATVRTLGLKIDSIIYEPSAYRDIILDIRSEGQVIEAGTRLSEGSAIVLVVGQGKGTEEVITPSIVGKNLEEARSWLFSHQLSVGMVEYDTPPTEETIHEYIVYTQSPESGTIVVEGTNVNIKLSLDIEKTVTADNEQDEEDFW